MPADGPPVVVIRTVFRGRVWTAIPYYLIEDSPERVVAAVLPGARCRMWDPAARADVCTALASGQWETVETTWYTNRVLLVWPRGTSYMIGHFWDDATDRFRGWYLNLQTPSRRSALGFDLWDQLLDVVVRPDRTWFWKDEVEFAEAVRLGVIGPEEAEAVRVQGVRLTSELDAPLPTGWENWRPAPGWPALKLPVGWDYVDESSDESR